MIAQESLSAFREAVAQRQADPYSFLMRSNKLPMGLVAEKDGGGAGGAREAKVRVQTAPFGETFGPKAKRKRVSLGVGGVEEMAGRSEGMLEDYRGKLEQTRLVSSGGGVGDNGGTGVGEEENLGDQRGLDDNTGEIATPRDPIFSKGQSRRIWNEAYKVIDSSDVIIQVLDARDPEGTRCRHLERFLKEEAPHKHMIFLLNKCDLVPSKVAVSLTSRLIKFPPPPKAKRRIWCLFLELQDVFHSYSFERKLSINYSLHQYPKLSQDPVQPSGKMDRCSVTALEKKSRLQSPRVPFRNRRPLSS